MPAGVPPLVLFRTMARSPRVFARMFAGGLLDKSPLSLRQREIVIDRTTARWAASMNGASMSPCSPTAPASRRSTWRPPSRDKGDASCWSADEQALLGMVDDLVDRRTIGEATWTALARHLDEAQILEAIALVGYYDTISFLCRGLDLPLEDYAARFPD